MGKRNDPRKRFLSGYLEAERRLSLKREKSTIAEEAPAIRIEAAHLLERRAVVLAAIESAPEPIMRTILEARYINGLKWEDIARMTGYSVDNAFKIHQKALRQMNFPDYASKG